MPVCVIIDILYILGAREIYEIFHSAAPRGIFHIFHPRPSTYSDGQWPIINWPCSICTSEGPIDRSDFCGFKLDPDPELEGF